MPGDSVGWSCAGDATAGRLTATGVGPASTVALESPGVYWVPFDARLEQHGSIPYLVTARHVKTVPGRTRDWTDAQGLQKRHALGLVPAAFRPAGDSAARRPLVRDRAEVIQQRAPPILHLHKARQQMNIQRARVLSDRMGGTGQLSVRALVAGERDPVVWAQHRNPACQSRTATIANARTGRWQDAWRFVLQQALVSVAVATTKMAVWDTQRAGCGTSRSATGQGWRETHARPTTRAPRAGRAPARRRSGRGHGAVRSACPDK